MIKDELIETILRKTGRWDKEQGIRDAVDAFEQALLQQTPVMGSACDVVKWISKCPYNIDEATVPKAGIDAAPGQVVLNLSLSYKVWLDLQEVAKHCP